MVQTYIHFFLFSDMLKQLRYLNAITEKEKHIILNKLEFADQEIRQSFEKQKLNSL
jgi:hypothetical protein